MEMIVKFSEQITEIAKALSKFQGAICNPVAHIENDFYDSKYADLATIWTAIRKPLSECGLAIIQGAEVINLDASTYVTVQTILMHESGQSATFSLTLIADKYSKEGKLMPMTPQAIGSTITYGRRYGISSILGIAQEDDDANAGSRPGSGSALTATETLSALDCFYKSDTATAKQAKEYIQQRRTLIEKLPEKDRSEINAAFRKLIEKLEAPRRSEASSESKPSKESACDPSCDADLVDDIFKKFDFVSTITAVNEMLKGIEYYSPDTKRRIQGAASDAIKRITGKDKK